MGRTQELEAPPDTIEVGRSPPCEAGILNKVVSPLGLNSAISAKKNSKWFQILNIFYSVTCYLFYKCDLYPMPSSPLVIFE